MSESKHTPGPWEIREDNPNSPSVAHIRAPMASDELVATVYFRADARLIAAAPDLYVALTEALRWIGRLNDWDGAGDPDVDDWRAALAKAKGEQP